MAKTAEQTSPVPAPDLDAIAQQTRSEALRLLKLPALNRLRRDLRAMKDSAQDETVRKALREAVRQAATEKRRRRGDVTGPESAEASPGPKAGKAKAKRAEAAGKPGKPQRTAAEKAERKAARKAARLASTETGVAGDKDDSAR